MLLGPTAFSQDTPTGNAGDYSIDFGANGGSGIVVSNASFLNLAAVNDVMSFAFWMKKYDIVDYSSAFWAVSTSLGSGVSGFQANVPWYDDNIYFDTDGCCDYSLQRASQSIDTLPGYEAVGNDNWWRAWHHFVFLKNKAEKQIWIDGQQFLKGTSTSPLPTDFAMLWLGDGTAANNPMHGLMDDFAVYSTALSPDSIQLLFSGTSPTNLPGETALAYWSFDNPAVIGPAVASPVGFSFTLYDTSAHPLDTSTIALTLNGQAVTPTVVSSVGSVITVGYYNTVQPLPACSSRPWASRSATRVTISSAPPTACSCRRT